MKVSNDVISVLESGEAQGNKFYLPQTQLNRKLYQSTNKVLSALGGKWNRKQGAHVFDGDITDAIEQVLSTGEYTDKKKQFQFFETPQNIVDMVIERAGNIADKSVLEPSAGRAAIASKVNAKELHVIEIMDDNRAFLVESGYRVVASDFMAPNFEDSYDIILANPPFTRQQDVDHVTKMIKLAKEKVVAIMSPSFTFRDNKKSVEFRALLDKYQATIEKIGAGEFKSSGTMIDTVLVTINKV